MGVVYLAEQKRLHRQVALKLIRRDREMTSLARRRFEREIQAISRLDHVGICTVYEAGEHDGTPYMAMQFVRGQSMADWISERRSTRDRLSDTRHVHEVVRIVEAIARALHFAHEAGLVHRDVKPGNVILAEDGQPKLLDFGLARLEEETDGQLTLSGEAIGTPLYMAPEQIQPMGRTVDRRTDVYALGATLFEMLTLEPPFRGATLEELYDQILRTGKPDTRQHVRGLPQDLLVVLSTALDRDPHRRYRTAEDLAEDLRRVAHNEPILAKRPGVATRFVRWVQREPKLAALVLVFLLSAGLLGYLLAMGDRLEAGQHALAAERVDRLLSRGYYEHHHGSAESALAAFEGALEVVPGHEEAIACRSLALATLGRSTEALELLDRRADTALHRLRPLLLRRAGEEESARRLEAGLRSPKSRIEWLIQAWTESFRCHREKARPFSLAYDSLEQAVLCSPVARRRHIEQLIHFAYHLGDTMRIRKCIAAMDARWPDGPDKDRALVDALPAVDPERAVRVAQRILSGEPRNWYALQALATANLARSRYPEAIQAARKALAVQPRDLESHVIQGKAYQYLEEAAKAEQHLRAALAIDPDQPTIRVTLALTLLDCGKSEEAGKQIEQAARSRLDNPRDQTNLAHALVRLGRYEDAKGLLLQAVATMPRPVPARECPDEEQILDGVEGAQDWSDLAATQELLGEVYARQRDHEKAVEYFEQALQSDSDRYAARVNMARSLMILQRLAEARKHLEWAISDVPGRTFGYYVLGNVEQQAGDAEAAIRAYRSCLERDADHVEARYCLANLLTTVGCRKEAERQYEAVLRLRQDHAEALCNLGLHLVDGGRAEEGLVHLRRGHALGTKRGKAWRYDSASWIQRAASERDRQAKLIEMLEGRREEPEDTDGALDLACFAFLRGEAERALGIFRKHAAMPLMLELAFERRVPFHMSCALLEIARDKSCPSPRRVTLRNQAHALLERALELLDSTDIHGLPSRERRSLWRHLLQWKMVPEFEPVRQDGALETLDEAERRQWSAIWSRVDRARETLLPPEGKPR